VVLRDALLVVAAKCFSRSIDEDTATKNNQTLDPGNFYGTAKTKKETFLRTPAGQAFTAKTLKLFQLSVMFPGVQRIGTAGGEIRTCAKSTVSADGRTVCVVVTRDNINRLLFECSAQLVDKRQDVIPTVCLDEASPLRFTDVVHRRK
jgi:hypothetical protein